MRLALYPLVQQFQYRNGTNLVAGKIYVYYRGRTRLATIYKDQNGTIAQNPLTCDADGRAPCFVDTNYQYTIVVCDARGKELFSQDLDADNAININDALSGDSKLYIINSDGTISVNATSGDTWIQYDLGTFNKPLGVTEPLYWQQDDEEASIIGLHTEGLVPGISADFTELSAKVDELSGDVSYLSGASDYLSGVVEQKMDKSMSSEFYPSDNPSGFIGDEGLSNYQPVSGMTAYQEKGNYYSASNPSGFITGVDLSDYAKTEDLTAYQAKGDYYSASNPSGFINSDAISDMATTGFVADVSADITAMIPTALTGDYLDKASADTLYYGINNPSGFITGVDLDPYQTKEDMTAFQTIEGMSAYQPSGDYQPAGSYLSASESANFYPMTGNPSGFLTEHQSLDGLMQTSGLEYDGDKISGYMGSAFAGGGEVPEGVMVESAVGYNAVNEISGYNGSAIAQYGAEKQWLVHDDTLVHAANSAQYALGVNLSAVAQLLGIDETVLWSGDALSTSSQSTGSYIEPISAFNTIRMKWRTNDTGAFKYAYYPSVGGSNVFSDFQALNQYWKSISVLTNQTGFTHVYAYEKLITNTASGTQVGGYHLLEIVGIGRKQ